MATTIAFKVEVDGGQSIKELSNIEQQFEDINKSVEGQNRSVASARKALKEYQDIALQAGRTSPIGRAAIERAAQLRDQMTDLRNEVTRLSKDGVELQAALQLGETVTAGYGAFQGVIALVGVENEKLLETIAKLQAAQSVLMGIEKIRLALEKESVLMLQARVLWTKATTVATNIYTAAVNKATVATNALKAAMGIGILTAVAGAIAAIAMNWDKLTAAVGLNRKEHEKATSEYLKNSDKRIEAIKQEIELQQKSYDITIARLQVENKDATDAIRSRANVAKETYERELDLINQSIAERRRAMVGLKEESAAYQVLQEQIRVLEGTQRDYQFELDKIELQRRENMKKSWDALKKYHDEQRAAEEKLTAAARAEYEKRLAAAEEAKRKELELEKSLQKELEDILAATIEDPNLRRLAQLEIAHEREKQRLVEQYGERTELLIALEAKQAQEMAEAIEEIETMAREEKAAKDAERLALEQEEAIERFNMELVKVRDQAVAVALVEEEILDWKFEQGLIKESEYLEAKAQIADREIELAKRTAQAINAARQTTVNATANALGAISNLFKKGSKEAKAFAIAQLAVNTAQSIGSVIAGAASAAASGGPAAPFLLAAYIATGLATVLSALGQAKNILGQGSDMPQQSFSAPNISGSSVAAPSLPANTGGIEASTAGAQQQNMQVVVLASDVSNVNNQNTSIELASVF